MRNKFMIALLAALLAVLALCVVPALAESAEDGGEAEWTVMFYFCGSDLESKYGYASDNLLDISHVLYPEPFYLEIAKYYGVDPETLDYTAPGKVNILIETGGSKAWHVKDEAYYLDMDIDVNALQRWSYNVYPGGGTFPDGPFNGFELMQTLPLQSMADPQTLGDFIRWGAQTCPAKKYALVLWDHGGGASTGLFIDELFDQDVMYLYELKQALADGGTHLEALIIDACLMANLETAWNVKDWASWMVASEEIVPGKGTAVDKWLQELFAHPEGDGEWLGRCVCDMTQNKYADDSDEMAKQLLTWSVIDLSKVDRLVEVCGGFCELMADALKRYPGVIRLYSEYILKAEEYGDGEQNMHDLGAMIYNPETRTDMPLNVRDELMDALADAVTYVVRGPGRSMARGLSFCYPTDFREEELDVYAKNCPMPLYLAFLDAISPWTAPDWVYEQTERLPNIDDIEEFRITPIKVMDYKGMPGLNFGKLAMNVNWVYYRLYRLDEETGQVVRLGRTACQFDFQSDDEIWSATDPMHWPAVDDELCCIDMIRDNGIIRLYNIPVQINSQTAVLRCGRTISYTGDGLTNRKSDYEVYGVWEGFDETSALMNRGVKPLAMYSGQEYRFLYPVDGSKKPDYLYSRSMNMYRMLDIREIPLPAGTYYLEYEIEDSFNRTKLVDRFEIQWDGEEMTFPDADAWQGETEMKPVERSH